MSQKLLLLPFVFLLLYFLFSLSLSQPVWQRMSLLPFVASYLHIYILLSVPLLSLLYISLSSFSSSVPPFVCPGRNSCKYCTPCTSTWHFLFGWVGESTVIQTMSRNKICAPWCKYREVKQIHSWVYYVSQMFFSTQWSIFPSKNTEEDFFSPPLFWFCFLQNPLHMHISVSFPASLTLHWHKSSRKFYFSITAVTFLQHE